MTTHQTRSQCRHCGATLPDPEFRSLTASTHVRRIVRKYMMMSFATVILTWIVQTIIWGPDHTQWPLWYRILSYAFIVGVPVVTGYCMMMDASLRRVTGSYHVAAVYSVHTGHVVATCDTLTRAHEYVDDRAEHGESLDYIGTNVVVCEMPPDAKRLD